MSLDHVATTTYKRTGTRPKTHLTSLGVQILGKMKPYMAKY
jgi:hypothetical protein